MKQPKFCFTPETMLKAVKALRKAKKITLNFRENMNWVNKEKIEDAGIYFYVPYGGEYGGEVVDIIFLQKKYDATYPTPFFVCQKSCIIGEHGWSFEHGIQNEFDDCKIEDLFCKIEIPERPPCKTEQDSI